MSRDNNRNAMPEIARVVDDFRAVFGDVKVTYAKEGGKELGKPDAEVGIPISEMVIGPAYVAKHRGQPAADRLRADALRELGK